MNARRLWLLAVVAGMIGTGTVVMSTRGEADPAPGEKKSAMENGYRILAGGLGYAILRPGSGEEAKEGPVQVHYTGWLTNGTKFDSSVDRGTPFRFNLGGGQVIQGWDRGVKGMKVGEKRLLILPPALAYGEAGTPGGPIPANASLVFEVELLKVGAG